MAVCGSAVQIPYILFCKYLWLLFAVYVYECGIMFSAGSVNLEDKNEFHFGLFFILVILVCEWLSVCLSVSVCAGL